MCRLVVLYLSGVGGVARWKDDVSRDVTLQRPAHEENGRRNRFNKRFKHAPSYGHKEHEWKADKPIGLAGINNSWVPPLEEFMRQPLVVRRRDFARALKHFVKSRASTQCGGCGAAVTEMGRSNCVGLGSLPGSNALGARVEFAVRSSRRERARRPPSSPVAGRC